LPRYRQFFETAKRTWHGRSEAKAHGSLPMQKSLLHLPPATFDFQTFDPLLSPNNY
jgi:hypothetical protein